MDKELLSKVESLINLNMGDIPRLTHIKESLQAGKGLYTSDKNYLHSMSRKAGLVDSTDNEIEQIPEKPRETPERIPETYSRGIEVSQTSEVPSKLWYVGHVFFWIITGLICYILWKDKNEKMAKKHLIYSIPLGLVLMFLMLGVAFLSQLWLLL